MRPHAVPGGRRLRVRGSQARHQRPARPPRQRPLPRTRPGGRRRARGRCRVQDGIRLPLVSSLRRGARGGALGGGSRPELPHAAVPSRVCTCLPRLFRRVQRACLAGPTPPHTGTMMPTARCTGSTANPLSIPLLLSAFWPRRGRKRERQPASHVRCTVCTAYPFCNRTTCASYADCAVLSQRTWQRSRGSFTHRSGRGTTHTNTRPRGSPVRIPMRKEYLLLFTVWFECVLGWCSQAGRCILTFECLKSAPDGTQN